MKDFMTVLDVIIDLFLAAVGAYAIFTGVDTKRWAELKQNKILYPSNVRPEACAAWKGFLRFMRPALLIFGAGWLVCGVLSLLGTFVLGESAWLPTLVFCLFLFSAAFYVLRMNRAARRFW